MSNTDVKYQKQRTRGLKNSLFIFRRDLRISDNTALSDALNRSDKVYTCFIFDPRQITDKNEYKSQNAVQFMLNSIKTLKKSLQKKGGQLALFNGNSDEVIASIIDNNPVDAIFMNRDYTPFAIERDQNIREVCSDKGIKCWQADDYLLHEPEEIEKNAGGPYLVFTPFFKIGRAHV